MNARQSPYANMLAGVGQVRGYVYQRLDDGSMIRHDNTACISRHALVRMYTHAGTLHENPNLRIFWNRAAGPSFGFSPA